MFVPPPIHKHLAGLRLTLSGRDRRRARRHPSDRTRARFRLEGLEDRCLLSITEFPLPSTGSTGPSAIVSGPDNNLWFTISYTGGHVGIINPTTDAISEFPLENANDFPAAITVGPDGNLWFTGYNSAGAGDEYIGIINPTTHAVSEFALDSADATPSGITAGPDGNLWFPYPSANAIGTINPTTHAITEFTLPTPNASPMKIATGPDGNLWFLEPGANQVGEIDPTTHAITEFGIPTADANPEGITAGPDGNLWFTEASAGKIGMINPTTHAIVEFSTPTGGPNLLGITAGPDGNLWFAEANVGQIGEINPTTRAITESAIPYGNAEPVGIAAGPDGNLWFTDDGDVVGKEGAIGVVTLSTASTHFVLTQQPPASVTAGTPVGLTVQADDSSGNLDSSFNGTVAVALANNPGGATLGGTLTVTASGGVATFSGLTLDTADTGYTIQVSASGVNSATTSAITVTPATASQLVIHTQPSATATAGQAFGTQPEIDVEDQYDNVETGDNSTVVTASLESGTGPLQGTTTVTVSGGVATFTNLADNKAETISLDFTSGSLTNATSTNIVVSPAPASQLVIQTQPSPTATVGQAFDIQPVIDEEDQYGNLETGDDSRFVTASLESGTGPLQGTTTVNVLDGVATFPNLYDNKAETISLKFTSGSLSNATSANVVVRPAAGHLVIQTEPSPTATAGEAFATQPVIDEEDPYGNLETGDNSTVVTATLNSGAGPLDGTTTVTVSGGVATFTNLAENRAGTFALKFTSGSFTNATSTNIVVSPAAASQLVIGTQPSATATAGQAFGAQPVIDEEDPYGNLETADKSTVVTASLESGAGPLDGATTVTVSGGVAKFTSLADNKAETISLNFTSAGLTNATSTKIVVSPATASQLVIQTQPSPAATAGQPFAIQPVINEEDQYGNLETGDNSKVVTATLESGAGPLQGATTVTVAGGVATFTNVADNKAETISLKFTSASLSNAASANIVVSPATASQLVIGTQPSATATAGQAFATQPVIDEKDQFGNLEMGDSSTVVTAMPESGAGPLQGTTSVTVSGGVATFTSLADNKAETISLDFTSGSLTNATSNNIVVTPATATQLVVHTQPSSTTAAGQAFSTQPVIYEEDQFGNLETGDNSRVVTATLESGTGPLRGTTTVIVSGGMATFTNLADDRAETISLGFSLGNLTNATSTNIVVGPATASKLVIQTQPSPTATAGQAFATQPVIDEEDQFGNLETGDNSTVLTAALESGTGPLEGTTSVTVSGGVATFAGLADDTAESIRLLCTGGGLNALTNSIVVSPATASQLVITQQPTTTATAGQAFAAQPVIKEEDYFGNVETGDNNTTITASLGSGSGPLLGTTTIAVKGGVATFENLADDTAESITLTFTGLGLTAGPSSSVAVSPAKASQLVIHSQPSATATAGQPFASGPSVYEEDPFGNVETGDSSTVITATLTSGSGLLQGTTATVSGGVAAFTNLDDETAQTVSLTFTGGGLTSGASSSITVSPAAASKVVFGQQPASAAPGASITPAVTVKVEDAFNNVLGTDGSTVTLTLSSGTFEGGSTTAATAASSGVATFSNLKIDVPGSYTLSATDGTLTPTGASNSFTISPATARRLVIHTQPSSTATAGAAFGTQALVYEEDQFGNLVTGDNSTVVTASLESGAGPLQGTTTVTVSGGVATFTNLADNKAETIALNFTSGSLTNATSINIVVSPATASQLVIQAQPSATATAGQAFGTQPLVYEEDRFGNLETEDNSTVVTATLASGAGPLQGTTTVTVSGGVATFTSLADNKAETIALNLTSGSLTNATSNNIVVSPATASKLEIHSQPSSTVTAGQPFTSQPVIYEEDQFGNLETGDNSTMVTASLASGTGPLQGTTTVTVSSGVATFTNLANNRAETFSLSFRSGSLSSAATSPIALTAPAPTIRLEQVVTAQKTNKKGKPVGKPVLVGFALDYSTAMDPSTAGLAADYQVDSAVTKRVKEKRMTVLQPVKFTAAYNPTTNSVTLTIKGKPTFAMGGQIKVIASPPNGVSSEAGVLLDTSDTVFAILPKAKGIAPG